MKKLFNDLKRLKSGRNQYRIKPYFKFEVDRRDYCFSFLPTVLWMPWIYRYPGSVGIVDIWWLNFHIFIGKWVNLSCRNCKHQKKCVESGRLEWYNEDMFEKGEKCKEFEDKY